MAEVCAGAHDPIPIHRGFMTTNLLGSNAKFAGPDFYAKTILWGRN
jgi:hypothetical protein